MKTNGLSHTRKWLFIYLALVLFTSLGVYFLVYLGVSGSMAAPLATGGIDVKTGLEAASAPTQVAGLERRLLFILGGGFSLSVILGLIWVGITARHIDRPIHTIATAMKKLAKGQLNETVVVEASDELEQIASSINELAANLQELLLYIWKQTGQCHTLLEHIDTNADVRYNRRLSPESLEHLKQLSAAIDDLREIAKAYVFYDVRIEGTHTQAISDLGDGASPTELTRNYN